MAPAALSKPAFGSHAMLDASDNARQVSPVAGRFKLGRIRFSLRARARRVTSLQVFEGLLEGFGERAERAPLECPRAQIAIPTSLTTVRPIPSAGGPRRDANGSALLAAVESIIHAFDLELHQGGAVVVDGCVLAA